MDIQQVVIESLREVNPDVALSSESSFSQKLKDMGFDSIQFLGIVISICEKLGIDMGQVNSMQISTENTVNEFTENFKAYLPNQITA
jgi:acyl carrier protein